MTINSDLSVSSTGDIRRVGDAHGEAAPGYYSVIELHRWLQDLADDASSTGNDAIDISAPTPSDRSTDNIITLLAPYNIDDDLAEYLYDGSIVQAGGDTIYDGIVNFGNASFINVVQSGSIVAEDFWNSYTPVGFNGDTTAGISHRFLVKVRDGGADIDGRRLLGMAREFGNTFSEFAINGTTRGNNVLALSESTDLNNSTDEATVSGWTQITNQNEGFTSFDVNDDGTDENYYSNWDRDNRSINDLYERIKWAARRGSSETLYGLPGALFRGPTHEIPVTTGDTFTEASPITWTGGSGQLLASGDDKFWIQLLTGSPPADGVDITAGGNTATVNGAVTERTPTIGGAAPIASTGSAIIAPYGLGVDPTTLSAADKLTGLDNVLIVPPNNVSFTVSGLVDGEDRVLVAPESGGSIETDQFSLDSAVAANAGTLTINTAIPTDTPSSGTIRVFNGDSYSRIEYDSYTGAAFTLSGTGSPVDLAANANGFISYIDDVASGASLSFTSIFLAARPLFIRVRDGGASPIKTFETTGSLSSAGGSVNVIRTSDE